MNCQKIKQLRKAKSLTQIQLSAEMNMSQNAYSQMECGKTTLDNERIIILANILGTSPANLLSDVELILLKKLCENKIDDFTLKAFNKDVDTIKYLNELLYIKDSQISKLLKQNKTLILEAKRVQKVRKNEGNNR